MVGKAKMSVTAVSIDNKVVTVNDASSIGHNFTFKADLKVSKRTAGKLAGEGIDSPDLQWKETIHWFDQASDGTWRYVGEQRKDMYKENPNSNTFKPWRDSKYYMATDPSNDPVPPALKQATQGAPDWEKAAKHWIAENGHAWTVPVAMDRPALGLKPGETSGGGGGESLVKSNTRRRVIYFDLGFTGNGPRASATQILEMVNGKPTIIKFFLPGISKAEADDKAKLAGWRAELARGAH